ncbi:MAG: hypothetical protein JST00_19355 [Deltaproteobacteria bacterium]|nr:hypothetical protein [Deltaproteobacteria bacterium]
MRSLLVGALAGLSILAGSMGCSSAPENEDTEESDSDLVDSRWIGTFRNDAAKKGELRTLSLKGNGTAAVVLQECDATSCASVESTGTYVLGRREGNGERKLELALGAKRLAYRTRLNLSSFTIDAQSLSVLELEPASGAPKSPIVSFDLQRSEDLWCAATNDCNLQAVRAELGAAVSCVAHTCTWDRSSVCKPDANSDPLVVEPAVAGAPSGRMSAAGAWAGDRLFVFGGRSEDNTTLLADGGLYDPMAKSWTPLATAGAPAPREHAHAAGIAGKAVVVGGWLAGFADAKDGFAYDVATKTWSPLSIPAAVQSDWQGELFSAGGAILRQGKKNLLHRIDPATKTVAPVTNPPELAEVLGAGGSLDELRQMAVATPSTVVILVPYASNGGSVPSFEHNNWRVFEYRPATNAWSVADVGLGPIDKPTTIAHSAGNLVILSGDNPRNGMSGVVAVVDLFSKKAHVTSIGGGAAPSSAGWLQGWGGDGPPAFAIDDGANVFFDTLDVGRASWVHRTPWGSPPPRRSLNSERTAEVRVWSGTELFMWGGVDRQRVNGFDVTTFPTHVVRYSPARCTP